MFNKAPPIGIMPKNLHDQERLFMLMDAIRRHVERGCPVKREWVSELNGLVSKSYDPATPLEKKGGKS